MFALSPISSRRLDAFKRNRRGYFSFWFFLIAFVLSLGAEFIANDKPILASYKGELLFPAFVRLPGRKIRRLPRRDRLSRSGHLQGNRGPWLADLAADPLFLRHP